MQIKERIRCGVSETEGRSRNLDAIVLETPGRTVSRIDMCLRELVTRRYCRRATKNDLILK